MRQITQDAVRAFRNNENFNRGNMTVVPGKGLAAAMFLHGNGIAVRLEDGTLFVSSAGWQSVTTKERLNGLLYAEGYQGIYQEKFIWYWQDGTEFQSGWQEAKPI